MQLEQLKTRRKQFGWIFVTTLVIYLAVFSTPSFIDTRPNTPNVDEITTDSDDGIDIGKAIAIATFFVSISSLIGFLSTTVLAWRKEKRDGQSHDMELEKTKLEIAALRKNLNTEKSE